LGGGPGKKKELAEKMSVRSLQKHEERRRHTLKGLCESKRSSGVLLSCSRGGGYFFDYDPSKARKQKERSYPHSEMKRKKESTMGDN